MYLMHTIIIYTTHTHTHTHTHIYKIIRVCRTNNYILLCIIHRHTLFDVPLKFKYILYGLVSVSQRLLSVGYHVDTNRFITQLSGIPRNAAHCFPFFLTLRDERDTPYPRVAVTYLQVVNSLLTQHAHVFL